jgi:S-adenosylmethionine:tRNA ribosyltransferase-isomerase
MHGEHYDLTRENADIINNARAQGGRIITVGTTSTRVLETIAAEDGSLIAQSGVTHAFIYPGYRYKIVDGLLTNFHWPKSSLILLVSALYGRENTLEAYAYAVSQKMKLFSYAKHAHSVKELTSLNVTVANRFLVKRNPRALRGASVFYSYA